MFSFGNGRKKGEHLEETKFLCMLNIFGALRGENITNLRYISLKLYQRFPQKRKRKVKKRKNRKIIDLPSYFAHLI